MSTQYPPQTRRPNSARPTDPGPQRESSLEVEMHEQTRQEEAPQRGESRKPAALGLSLTQIIGGALAAMTAAAIGSRLGVAGTLVGAAMASIVAAVGSALYTASLRRTHHTVRTVWTGRLEGSTTPASIEIVAEPGPLPLSAERVHPRPGSGTDPSSTGLANHRRPDHRRPTDSRSGAGLGWRGIVVGALAAFAIAAASLTAFELVSGQSLSGESGTTIQRVSAPTSAKRAALPTETASTEPTGPAPTDASTAAPSEAATPLPTPSASVEPSSEPSATPTAEESSSAAPTDASSP